jgi:hypothetical protein
MIGRSIRDALAPNASGARMRLLWIVLVASTAAIAYRYPEQAWVLLSKLNRIALGAAVAVAIDRLIFWYARPSVERDDIEWQYRRAAIIVGGMMAAALAV